MSASELGVATLRSIQGIAISLALIVSFALIGRSILHDYDGEAAEETNLVFYGAIITLPALSLLLLMIIFLLPQDKLLWTKNICFLLLIFFFLVIISFIITSFVGEAIYPTQSTSLTVTQVLIDMLLGFTIFLSAVVCFLGVMMLAVDYLESSDFCSRQWFHTRYIRISTTLTKATSSCDCCTCSEDNPPKMDGISADIEISNNHTSIDVKDDFNTDSTHPRPIINSNANNSVKMMVRRVEMLSEDEQNMAVQVAAAAFTIIV